MKERPVSASVESSKTTKEPQKVENDAVDSLTEVKGPSNTVEAQDATDSIQVHVVGRDDNVELKVLDTTSISEVRFVTFYSRSLSSLRLTSLMNVWIIKVSSCCGCCINFLSIYCNYQNALRTLCQITSLSFWSIANQTFTLVAS